jgi:hypothetical protein
MIARVLRVMVVLALCGCDVVFRVDKIGPLDHTTSDAASEVDAPGDDLDAAFDGPQAAPCSAVRAGLIAAYPVDGDAMTTTLTDEVGNHDGALSPSTSSIAITPGPPDCGDALLFGTDQSVTIAGTSAFQLTSGSFDVWVRPIGSLNSDSPARVILARDLSGSNQAGDISLYQLLHNSETFFVVRQQLGASSESFRCSTGTLTAGQWYHVTVNFGAPGGLELYVDGTVHNRTGAIRLSGDNRTCGSISTAIDPGISGPSDSKPWLLGAGMLWQDNEMDTKMRYFAGGAIDLFRISSERR